MTYPNIALIGKARAGKDTVAAHFVQRYAYTRQAFADPLKQMAYDIDPVISGSGLTLADAVESFGWEAAKDEYPEVRRFLQHLGTALRERDEDYWLNDLLERIEVARKWNLPVVVTDCRYRNEAAALRNAGFELVRIHRPGTGGDTHISETELDDYPVDRTLWNGGTLEELRSQIGYLL